LEVSHWHPLLYTVIPKTSTYNRGHRTTERPQTTERIERRKTLRRMKKLEFLCLAKWISTARRSMSIAKEGSRNEG
jgi:hypothetical protein